MTTTARHRPSRALNNEENDALFTLLGHGCEAKASGVVQVFVTSPPHHSTWFKRTVGVATFSKDNNRKSFYIQVYDITVMARVLEQEIYKEFEYISSVPFFHQFEGEERMIGLNFSNDEDALNFSNAVTEVLANRKRRREERRRQMMAEQQRKLSEGLGQPQRQHQQEHHHHHHHQHQQEHHQQKHQQHHDEPKHKDRRRFGKIGTKREKRKFRKSMIGDPFGFQHVSHAGFDNNNTFSSFNVDEDLEHLFTVVGLDKKTMADDKTRKFVYDFIENHGGFEEAKKASRKYSTRRVLDDHTSDGAPSGRTHGPHVGVRSHGPHAPASRSSYSQAPVPPPPARDPPPPPLGGRSYDPSLPLCQDSNGGRHDDNDSEAPFPPPKNYHRAPPSPSIETAPPLLTHRATSVPPPPMQNSNLLVPPPPPLPKKSDNASSQSLSNYYVPPPPSPISKGSTIPPPPPPPPSIRLGLSAQDDAEGLSPSLHPPATLLDQIRSGTKPLKKVEAAPQPAQTDGRMQLLDDIKNGTFRLHKVSLSECDTKGDEPLGLEGIALDLHRALQERAQFIQPDDGSDDSTPDDDDDSEWDTD